MEAFSCVEAKHLNLWGDDAARRRRPVTQNVILSSSLFFLIAATAAVRGAAGVYVGGIVARATFDWLLYFSAGSPISGQLDSLDPAGFKITSPRLCLDGNLPWLQQTPNASSVSKVPGHCTCSAHTGTPTPVPETSSPPSPQHKKKKLGNNIKLWSHIFFGSAPAVKD